MGLPTVSEVRAYLGVAVSHTDEVLTDALDAESAAQARVCRVDEANYPADLRQALMRRIARNLSMRRLPLGVQTDETGGYRIGATDPEVRRLEAPHRRVVVG
jgi:hypothetical protein